MNWKEFIEQNLLNQKGFPKFAVNREKTLDSKFPQIRSVSDQIREDTSFLSSECKNYERLYCLYNNIKEETKCKACKKNKVELNGFKVGYYDTCSRDCYLKFQHIKQADGLTLAERRSLSTAKTMRETIIDGKNLHQIRAAKVIPKTVASLKQIGSDGLSAYQRNGLKAKVTGSIIDETGTSPIQRGIQKGLEKFKTVGDDGLTLKQRCANKMVITKSIIGKDGLTIAERSSIKAENTKARIGSSNANSRIIKHYNERIHFQGDHEEHFLKTLNELNILDFISNGPCIRYLDMQIETQQRMRTYRSDFIKNIKKDIIFEVKSNWTYDKNGDLSYQLTMPLRLQNNSKWLAALQHGFRMVVVWDMLYMHELFLEDFSDMSKSVLRKVPLTNESLLSFFN